MVRLLHLLFFLLLSITSQSWAVDVKSQNQYVPNFAPRDFGQRNKPNYGYVDKSGKVLIKPQYKEAKYFINERAIVSTNEGYFFIDSTGKQLGSHYDTLVPTNDNRIAAVRKNNLWGIIDNNGNALTSLKYSKLLPCYYIKGKSRICAELNGKHGVINEEGSVVIPFIYDDMGYLNDRLWSVSKNDKVGVINYNNELILPLKYDLIYSEWKLLIVIYKDKFGAFSLKGRMIIPPIYRTLKHLDYETLEAQTMDQKYYIHFSTKGEFKTQSTFPTIPMFDIM